MDELTQAQQKLGRNLERARAGEDRALATQVRELGERLASLLTGTLGMSQLHDLGNRAFDQPVRDLAAILESLIGLLGVVHLLTVEDQVYVNDIRIRLEGTGRAGDLGARLRRHATGGISIHTALSESQLRDFIACLAAPPATAGPRTALQAALVSRGLDGIDTTGIHRFRVSGEQEEAKARDARAVARHATGLIEENLDNLGANRLPNPLPLRRVVTEILEAGPHGEGLWEEPDAGSAYAAHTVRTCKLALLLGQALGLSEGALQDLGVAVMFHDVGYAAREGAETGASGAPGYAPPFERHASAGAGLILRQRGFHEAKIRRLLATLDHHRRYDDPRGKPSLFGRIMAIVEDFDTLIRPGGGALPPDQALARIAAGAGTVYDPALTQLFINALGRFPPGTPLRLRDGCQVRVVAPARGPEAFERPLVRVERLADGSAPAQPMLLDLSRPAGS